MEQHVWVSLVAGIYSLRLFQENYDRVVLLHEFGIFFKLLLQFDLLVGVVHHDYHVGLESLDCVDYTLALAICLGERVHKSATCEHAWEDWVHTLLNLVEGWICC